MAKAAKHDSYPVKFFENDEAFEKWLSKNYGKEEGIWLKFAKKQSGIESIYYAGALDVALCYGWIDGLARSLDEEYYLQKYTPRRTKSVWSVINKKKVGVLIRNGRMKPPGLAAVKEAKKDGRWAAAYHSSTAIKIPPLLDEALKKNKKANAFFEKLSAQNRYAILYRLTQVKTEATRIKKIGEYMAMLENHITIYPQK